MANSAEDLTPRDIIDDLQDVYDLRSTSADTSAKSPILDYDFDLLPDVSEKESRTREIGGKGRPKVASALKGTPHENETRYCDV